jgi:serine protease Do
LLIETNDSRMFEANVIASNSQLDLATLRVSANNLVPARVADSTKLRVGEIVFAIGNPWGQTGVVTQGIVSAIGSIEVRGGRKAQYIRSDVQLAPGNSGGPLLNAEGAVVGINAMIFGGDLSVAIPSHIASEWIAGQPDRPVRLGVGVQPVVLPTKEHGLLVVDVEAESPASNALMIGDVLTSVSGESIDDLDRFQILLGKAAKSHGFTRLGLLRGGTKREVEVKL